MNKRENTAVSIYNDLRQKIIHLEYKPGEILNETQLAELYLVSRTPVREALHRLKYDGLIQIFPKIGAQVVQIDLQYLKKSFDVKKALDSLAMRLAIDNSNKEDLESLKELVEEYGRNLENLSKLVMLDAAFHHKIAQMANNEVLDETLDTIQSHLIRLWYYTGIGNGVFEQFYGDFKEMIRAIEEKDYQLAEKLAVAHVDVYHQKLKEKFI